MERSGGEPWPTLRWRPDLLETLSQADQEALDEVGGWAWCMRCARVWPVFDLRLVHHDAMLRYSESPWFFGCADEQCGGAGLGGYGELWGYTRLRRRYRPDWPEVPKAGQRLELEPGGQGVWP